MEKKPLTFGLQTKNIEDAFFLQQDKILMEKFRQMQAMKETKESLAAVSGITDDAVLEKLVELDVRPDVVASLALIPLVEVAWADGFVDAKEKEAIIKADSQLFDPDSIDMAILRQWLEHKPDARLIEAWEQYTLALCRQMTDQQKLSLRDEVIGHARSVAQAAGGFLGFNTISEAEQKVLNRLEKAFA